MKIYIDDVLVKSKIRGNHICELGEAFELMRRHHLHLNPAKCGFGVSLGKFLGHIISR